MVLEAASRLEKAESHTQVCFTSRGDLREYRKDPLNLLSINLLRMLSQCNFRGSVGSQVSDFAIYFFPKKLMILPCPAFPPAFLPFPSDDVAVDVSARCFWGGSSSEKDSQAGSSFVTRRRAP